MERDDTNEEPDTPTDLDDPPSEAPGREPRVDVDTLDALLRLVGDLGAVEHALDRLSENLHARGGDDAFAREARQARRRLRRGLSALREGVLGARVVRLDRLFAGAVARVHELAGERGKRVRVITRGGAVDLDRALADDLDDVLARLVRNAVAYGVEPVPERLAAGKSETGTIELSADAGAGRVRLCVADDGAGLAAEALRKRAIERGLLPADVAREMDPAAVAPLAFAAGLSTAPEGAEGDGLDAVRATVARLGGSIALESAPGVGTRITLSVPLTLLRLHALVFDLHGRPTAVARDAVRAVRTASGADAEGRAAVIVDLASRQTPLVVEQVRGHAQLVVKPLGPSLATVPAVVGAAELDSGDLALVLDPAVPWVESDGPVTTSAGIAHVSSDRPAERRAVARALVVELGATRRALDLATVRGVEPVGAVTPVPGAPAGVLGVALMRGAVTTVLDGRRIAGDAAGAAGGPLVLVDVGDEVVALRVDRVIGVDAAAAGTHERPPLLEVALTPRRTVSDR